jgi:hypothetical protein
MSTFILLLVSILGGFVIIISWLPDNFRVSRSATIAAPAHVVYEHINDLHKWDDWSPWAKLDPNAKNSFDGAPLGPGASFSWSGNSKVGAGRMTILESRPDDLIRIKLEMTKPIAATNAVEFALAEEGESTKVTWTMAGKNSFISKAMGLFMNVDKMCGGQFETGLANLKAVAEKHSA